MSQRNSNRNVQSYRPRRLSVSGGVDLLKHPTYCLAFSKFRSNTLIGINDFCANLRLANSFRHLPGAIVECGTWKGGMIAGLAWLFGPKRSYYLFDSYEGLPPPSEIDGERARRWQTEKNAPNYNDNCRASIEDARNVMQRAGIRDAKIVKGWFEDTLPKASIEDGISILRMDADWYDSTMCILENLFDQVVPGGCVIIDDYYCWDGCCRAVHDFLTRNNRLERINMYNDRVPFFVKRPES